MAKWPYNTTAWQRLRLVKLRHDPLCAHCKAHGTITPATQVDHETPIRQGGAPFDLANLQSLCQSCHSSKTATEDGGFGREGRIKGCDAEGVPLDPRHPWRADRTG